MHFIHHPGLGISVDFALRAPSLDSSRFTLRAGSGQVFFETRGLKSQPETEVGVGGGWENKVEEGWGGPGSRVCFVPVSEGCLQRENTSHHPRKRPCPWDADTRWGPYQDCHQPRPSSIAPILFSFVSWLVFFKYLYAYQVIVIILALDKLSAYWGTPASPLLRSNHSSAWGCLFRQPAVHTCYPRSSHTFFAEKLVGSAGSWALPSPRLVKVN